MYRCLVCGEILRNDNQDTLIVHLRRKHPFINVSAHIRPRPVAPRKSCPPPCSLHTPCITCKSPSAAPPVNTPFCPQTIRPPITKEEPWNCCPCPPQPCPPPPPNPPVPCQLPYAVNCPPPTKEDYCKAMARKQQRESRTKYKCSIESWKPGSNKVICPRCGYEAQPIIRRQHNQMTDSPLQACIMLGCWPFTLLPFLMSDSNIVNLYCGQCNNFLGTYNRKLGCVVDIGSNFCNPM